MKYLAAATPTFCSALRTFPLRAQALSLTWDRLAILLDPAVLRRTPNLLTEIESRPQELAKLFFGEGVVLGAVSIRHTAATRALAPVRVSSCGATSCFRMRIMTPNHTLKASFP